MGLDIRLPIGGMFATVGLIITLFGLLTGNRADIYHVSLGININLWWGMILFLFGAAMLFFGWRGTRSGVDDTSAPPSDEAPHVN